MTGTEIRTADVSVDDKGKIEVTSGREPQLVFCMPLSLLQA